MRDSRVEVTKLLILYEQENRPVASAREFLAEPFQNFSEKLRLHCPLEDAAT